jgi:type II secretory pathway pseudopilin PulG
MTASGRSTAAALILFFALIFALMAAIIVPTVIRWTDDGRVIRDSRERSASIRQKQTTFVRIKNASDRWTVYARSADAGFLDAPSAEDALGVASAHVSALVDRHAGSLEKIEFAPGDPRRGMVDTVRIDLKATFPKSGLAPFLAELEDSPPYTFISAFRVTERRDDRVTLIMTGQMQHLTGGPS